jgi:hypothetical protein
VVWHLTVTVAWQPLPRAVPQGSKSRQRRVQFLTARTLLRRPRRCRRQFLKARSRRRRGRRWIRPHMDVPGRGWCGKHGTLLQLR